MSKDNIRLSDHFNYKRLIRFTLPSIISMILIQVYTVIDGLFVSNFVGKEQFVGINLMWPALAVLGSVGNMLGVGGAALVGKILGEGDRKKANGLFSFFIYFMIALGAVIAVIGNVFLPQIAELLGAEGVILEYSVLYGRICMCGVIFVAMQYTFQSFLITAEKPKLGLYITFASGITNIALDALFILGFKWGLAGAAIATVLSQIVGSVVPMIMFLRPKNNWILKLGKPIIEGKALLKSMANGSSEFVTNVSVAVVAMLFNFQLLKYAGNDGVAAYGTLMYLCLIFIAIFFGFTSGVSPIYSYQYGAENTKELKNLFKKSVVIIALFSLLMFGLAEALAYPVSYLFVGYDTKLMDMTLHAFKIFSLTFLFSGIGIFGSSLFTALNNGFLSAMLSFVRSLVLQAILVFTLPLLWGIDGIWWSAVLAELLAALLSVIVIIVCRKRYKYL